MRKLLLILLFIGIGQGFSQTPLHLLIAKKASTGCDADAEAFFTATGITDATIKTAICDLVIDLKANSLWTKFYAIYPFVGGDATTHKFNLKNPADNDASFRITWSGTVTHSSDGVVSNGSTGFGDTHLVPNTTMSLDDAHVSFYSRTDIINADYVDMGCTSAGARTRVILSLSDGNDYGELNSASANTYTAGNTDKYQILSRESSTTFDTYDNGSVQTRSAAVSTSLPTTSIYILAQNDNGVTDFYSLRQCAFATIGTKLTSGQAATLNTIVEAFQDALGRGVQ